MKVYCKRCGKRDVTTETCPACEIDRTPPGPARGLPKPNVRYCNEELKPILKEACLMWNDYRDYWSVMTEKGAPYCLPPTLAAAFERLGEVLRVADPSIAEVE